MDAQITRLAVHLEDEALAETLVKAGFVLSKQIKAATDKELLAIPGIGEATVRRIRERLPHVAGRKAP